jgi:glycosyltransferase involved in cell wall biosynthesis
MFSKPDVSVVVPTCGRPGLVGRAIRSALAQTVENIEVVVVIDGPDDETRAVLRRGLRDLMLRRRKPAPAHVSAGRRRPSGRPTLSS